MRKRKPWIKNGIGYIPLTRQQVAKVSPSQLKELGKHNWTALWHKTCRCFYAVTNVPKASGGYRSVKLHRMIADVSDPRVKVDHEDHDMLNNQDDNLRTCEHRHNMFNMRKHRNNSTGYKGVTFNKRDQNYVAQINIEGKRKWLGARPTAAGAAKLYRTAAKLHYGNFACE